MTHWELDQLRRIDIKNIYRFSNKVLKQLKTEYIFSSRMKRFSMLIYEINGGGSSSMLMPIDKIGGASLSYYYSAIFYVYFAVFLMYLIWALMLYLEESILNDNWDSWTRTNILFIFLLLKYQN